AAPRSSCGPTARSRPRGPSPPSGGRSPRPGSGGRRRSPPARVRIMRRPEAPVRTALIALSLVVLAGEARADLDEYLAKPEPAFKWELKAERAREGCTIYDLHLTALEWHGHVWEHRLLLARPEKGEKTNFCALDNSSGEGGENDEVFLARFVGKTGTCAAVLLNTPKQPLWGQREDGLVVHTWLEFVKSMKQDGKGDESWPLHFPMAKAVLKAMDVIQALAREKKLGEIDGFCVSGGSKQGWTAWLVGASKDPRVKAIAPRVIDVLNVKAQAYHQLAEYGAASERVKQY